MLTKLQIEANKHRGGLYILNDKTCYQVFFFFKQRCLTRLTLLVNL